MSNIPQSDREGDTSNDADNQIAAKPAKPDDEKKAMEQVQEEAAEERASEGGYQ